MCEFPAPLILAVCCFQEISRQRGKKTWTSAIPGSTLSWDHLRTTQQAVAVATALETRVYPKSGVATVLLTQITAFRNMSPCRYISRRNSVCFPLLHLKCHRGADVFILTSSAATTHLKYTQHCSVGSLERCTEYGFPWPFDVQYASRCVMYGSELESTYRQQIYVM